MILPEGGGWTPGWRSLFETGLRRVSHWRRSTSLKGSEVNIIVWADIPVSDLDRAARFYAHVLGMPVNTMPGMEGIAIPGSQPADGQPAPETPPVAFDLYVGGKPSVEGVTVYLSAMGDFPGVLARVREAGGEILQEPQDMGEMIGTLAFFKDTEGNRIGLHQPPAGM